MKNLDISAPSLARRRPQAPIQSRRPLRFQQELEPIPIAKVGSKSSDISGKSFSRVRIAGTPVSIASLPRVLSVLEDWVREKSERYIVCRDVHGVIRARRDERLHDIHERADIVTPDGMPLVWTAKLLGHTEISRVCGPDLLATACEHGVNLGWKHYFYGGAPDVARKTYAESQSAIPRNEGGRRVFATPGNIFRRNRTCL